MGKKIRQNVTILLNRLGEYAFPNGKPTLDWSGGGGDDPEVPTYAVQKNIGTGLSASGGDDDVSDGGPLEVTISVINDLYIIDEDNVEVTMGGSPVQGAFDAATGKITIAEVYGEVVINVPSMTYVGYGETNSPLVSMFDGKNRGGTTGQWKDLIVQTRILTMTNCTENSDNVYFNGQDAKAVLDDADAGVDIGAADGAIECVFKMPTLSSSAFNFPVTNHPKSGTRLLLCGLTNSSGTILASCYQGFQSGDSGVPNAWVITGDYTKSYLSMSNTRAYHNGAELSRANAPYSGLASSNSRLAFFSFKGSNGTQYYREGTLYCVRFYSRPLTVDEIEKNYKVDRKRFNLQ